MGNSNTSTSKNGGEDPFAYNQPLGAGHPYIKPEERGKRVLTACIEQVKNFESEYLPKIEATILKKQQDYKEDIEKINVNQSIWYDDVKNDRPVLNTRTKDQIISTIGKDRFKLIADIELLAGLIGKYKSKSKGNDESKCLAFEQLSQKLHRHNFFVKNKLYQGILADILDDNDPLVNYKSPREKSFFMKSKKSKKSMKSKRRSPKRSIKRKSQKSKRRSPKRSKSMKRKLRK